jgi:hypothetical protein
LTISQKPFVVLSSGPITASPNTQTILVDIFNSNLKHWRKVNIEIKNWTTCPPEEIGKFVYLCGKQINPEDIDYNLDDVDINECFDDTSEVDMDSTTEEISQQPGQIMDIPDIFPPIITPVSFIIPAQSRFTILAVLPKPIAPLRTVYEIRINLFNPLDVLFSSFGLNVDGVPQEGNTILNNQFIHLLPPAPFPPIQFIPQRPF